MAVWTTLFVAILLALGLYGLTRRRREAVDYPELPAPAGDDAADPARPS